MSNHPRRRPRRTPNRPKTGPVTEAEQTAQYADLIAMCCCDCDTRIHNASIIHEEWCPSSPGVGGHRPDPITEDDFRPYMDACLEVVLTHGPVWALFRGVQIVVTPDGHPGYVPDYESGVPPMHLVLGDGRVMCVFRDPRPR